MCWDNKWLRRLKRIPLMVINGSLRYKLQKISFFQSIDYSMIITIHQSRVDTDITFLTELKPLHRANLSCKFI